MLVAIARPTAMVTLPSQQQTIILAIDVSLSMGATDVEPNRLTAAQAAAKSFIEEHPTNARIGIVAFGASASLVQPPTRDKEALLAAIDSFQLQRGTATGSALYVALATLFPDAGIDVASLAVPGGFWRGTAPERGKKLDARQAGAEEGRAGSARLVQQRRRHPDERRPPNDRSRSDGRRAHGGRPRICACSPSASALRPAR